MSAEVIKDRLFSPHKRFTLREYFLQRPALNAVIGLPGSDSTSPTAAAFLAYNVANKNFEVLGTNMTTALATFATGGGITLTTAGADNDQGIVCPHLDTTQTGWSSAAWTTAASTNWRAIIKTGASIAANITYAGLKLTNTPTIATDDNQVYFRYLSSENGGKWQLVHSRAGTDTTTVSEVTVAASTVYDLAIEMNADRTFRASINGRPIATQDFPALTDAITLIPYAGVAASGAAAAKAVDVKYIECSRLY